LISGESSCSWNWGNNIKRKENNCFPPPYALGLPEQVLEQDDALDRGHDLDLASYVNLLRAGEAIGEVAHVLHRREEGLEVDIGHLVLQGRHELLALREALGAAHESSQDLDNLGTPSKINK